MEKSNYTIKLKHPHLMAILFVLGLFIGVFAGYFIGAQVFGNLLNQQTGGQNSDAGLSQAAAKEALFVKYAQDLGLDKKKFETCLNNDKYAGQVTSDLNVALAIGLTGTPSFIVNGRATSGALPYDAFKELLDNELINATNRSLALGLVNTSDPTMGNTNAPIVMIEFSDYQCPYCALFWKNTLPSIKKDYIDTGKVLFVYKNFPLSRIHSLAQKAAEVALCAGEQGKYWEYHDTLFSKQAEWGS